MWSLTKAEATTAAAEGISNREKAQELEECQCANLAENSGSLQNKFNSANSKEDQQNIGKEFAHEDEAIDSGFISGLNTSSSLALTEEKIDSGAIAKDIKSGGPQIKHKDTKNPQQQQQHKSQQKQDQESKTFLDSGCIEAEDFDDDEVDVDINVKNNVNVNEVNNDENDKGNNSVDASASATISGDLAEINISVAKRQSDTKQAHNELQHNNNQYRNTNNIYIKSNITDQMRFKNNVDSGITERFCSLSLQSGPINNLNATTTTTNRRHSSIENATPDNNNTTTNINNYQTNRQQSLPSSSSTATTTTQKATTNKSRLNDWEEFYQQNSDGDTPLHLACLAGAEEVVAALLRIAIHPCLYNIQNDDAQTPLHMAALSAHPKILRMLLLMGAESSVRDRHGNTALHLAVNSGEEQCVRALILPISSGEVQEALRSYAPRFADKKFYTANLKRLPMDLEICNYNGEKCIHLAAQEGHINILRQLVSCGANINAREGKSGRTPLHIAIENCNEGVVNFLLDECHNELNLETATYAGLTAYQVACLLEKEQLLCILEKRGAEPLTPPESDYDGSDSEDIDDSKIFGDPSYFVSYNGPNAMRVA